jgi:hypothetical protein
LTNNINDSAQNVENKGINKEKHGDFDNKNEKTQLNELKRDIDELSDEVQTSVVDLKKSITDIRSTVSEIENPFNVLKTISNEKDIEKLNQGRLPAGVKSIILERKEEIANRDKEDSLKLENTTPQIEDTTKEKNNKIVQSPLLKPIKTSEYIGWIWELLDVGLAADNIRQFACSCELMGYLPLQANDLIYSLALTAEKFRSLGLAKGHLLLFLYKTAAMSKTNVDSDDMETLISVTEYQLKKPSVTEYQLKKPKPNRGTK